MREFHGRASARMAAAPEAIFGLITDLDRLTEWNGAIEALVQRPADLVPGAEWQVTMHPPGLPRWGSISRVQDIDAQGLRFAYETRNADGNPSRVRWAWELAATGAGTEVTVTWDCYLRTADRRLLAGPMRKRQLAREVPRSLSAIDSAVRARGSAG